MVKLQIKWGVFSYRENIILESWSHRMKATWKSDILCKAEKKGINNKDDVFIMKRSKFTCYPSMDN